MAAKYILKLYITGRTVNSEKAIKNLKAVLDTQLKELYSLEVIDVLKHPQLAEEDKILATPTVMKVSPPPARKIIGDLSDKEKVLSGLGLTIEKKERSSSV
jgi:circadian clock protein KaiB